MGGIRQIFALAMLTAVCGCGLKTGKQLQSDSTDLNGWWLVSGETCAGAAVKVPTGARYTFDGDGGTYQYVASPGCTVALDLGLSYPSPGALTINFLSTLPNCSPVGCDAICNVPAPSYSLAQLYSLNGGILTLNYSNTRCPSNILGQDITTLRKQ